MPSLCVPTRFAPLPRPLSAPPPLASARANRPRTRPNANGSGRRKRPTLLVQCICFAATLWHSALILVGLFTIAQMFVIGNIFVTGAKANPFLMPRKPNSAGGFFGSGTVASCSSLPPSTFPAWQVPSDAPFPAQGLSHQQHLLSDDFQMSGHPIVASAAAASSSAPSSSEYADSGIRSRLTFAPRSSSAHLADSIVIVDDDEAQTVAYSVEPHLSFINYAPTLPHSVHELSHSYDAPLIGTGSADSSVSSSLAIQALQSMHEDIRIFRERRSRVAEAAMLVAASASPWAPALVPGIVELIVLPAPSASSSSSSSDELCQFAAAYRNGNVDSSNRIANLPVSMLRSLVSDLIVHVCSASVTRALESLAAVQLNHSSGQHDAPHQTQENDSRAEQQNRVLAQLQRMYWQTLLRLLSVRTIPSLMLKHCFKSVLFAVNSTVFSFRPRIFPQILNCRSRAPTWLWNRFAPTICAATLIPSSTSTRAPALALAPAPIPAPA